MSKKILVVDDDRNIGQILYVSFKSKGYETIVAKNGEEALRLFQEMNPDLILLDILLPKMNGWEVCQRIKETEEGKLTPIILMSAIYKSYKLQAEARKKYGANDFIEKPFQLSALLDKVYSYIGEGKPEGSKPVTKESSAEAGSFTEADINKKLAELDNTVLEGTLGEFAFPSLIHKIHVLGRSGILYLTADNKSKELAFKEGYPVSVKTNIEDEFLGQYLVGIKKVTQEQCEESLKLMDRSGRLQGTVLIEMGLLTPNELVRYLKLQMLTKIFEVFTWLDGDYQFIEDDTVVGDISNIDISPANIIYRGVSGHFGLERLISYVDRFSDKYFARSSNMFYRFQDLDLAPSESKLLQLINGTHQISTILAESELDLDKTYQLLYTLLITEICEPLNEPTEQDDLASLIEQEVSGPDTKPDIPSFEELLNEAEETGEEIAPEQTPVETEPEEESSDFTLLGDSPAPDKSSEADDDEAPRLTEDAELRMKILTKAEDLETKNYFELLGISDAATEHDVRVAYHKLAKDFHPDRFFGKISPALKNKAEEVFLKLTDAYNALATSKQIEEYRKQLEGTSEPKPDVKMEGVKAVIRAERSFQEGVQAMTDHNWQIAMEKFKKAMTESPSEPEYQAYYGWALFNLGRINESNSKKKGAFSSAGDLQYQGREELNRVLESNPRLEKGYVFLGYIYKSQGMKEFAERQFEKALLSNPNCMEALRELRLMRLAEQRSRKKSRSIFGKAKDVYKKLVGR